MAPFEPVGEKPRWALALEVIREYQVGDVVPYEALHDAVGSPNRTVVQAAARDAGVRFLEDESKALEAVPNEGYRIVAADEHVRLAKSQQRRGRRALVRGQALASNVDFNELSAEGRRIAEATAYGFGRMLMRCGDGSAGCSDGSCAGSFGGSRG